MSHIYVIEEELIKFYKNEKNYFEKFLKASLQDHYRTMLAEKLGIGNKTLQEAFSIKKESINSQILKLQSDLTFLSSIEQQYTSVKIARFK